MPSIVSDWSSCLDNGDVATLRCIPIVLQNIINSLVMIAGIACIFIIIYAGIKFVTSEGDPEKVAAARKTVLYGVGGFILVLGSFLVLNLLATFTGVDQLTPH